MACLEMYNNSSPSPSSHSQSPSPPLLPPPPMSPRISFSNDFVESHHHLHQTHNSHHLLKTARSSEPPPSSDFEFNVTNGNILSSASADELFFKGKLLPFKDTHNNNNSQMQRTLRDELLVDDEADLPFSLKPPKGSSSSSSNRWKGFLGLRKSHIGSKKPEKLDTSFDSGKRFSFPLEDPNLTKSPQEMVSSESPSSSDMEMGI